MSSSFYNVTNPTPDALATAKETLAAAQASAAAAAESAEAAADSAAEAEAIVGLNPSDLLLKANNLGDLGSAAAARNNLGLASVASSGSASDLSGTLPASGLPNPSPTTLGGVKSKSAASHQFLTSIGTDGSVGSAQPSASDITGLAPSATVDATNATNISSGVLAAGRLPNPSPTTLGGVKSLAPVSNQFLTSIGTDGGPTQAQPSFANLSGSVSASQMPALTGDITTVAGTVSTTISAGVVDNTKLASGAAVANIGYTPANKAGDTFSGNVGVNASYLNFGSTLGTSGYGLKDNSGVIEVKNSGGQWTALKDYFVALTSSRTLTNNTSAQAIFAGGGGPTNGQITLPVGTYFFEMKLNLSGLSTSSHGLSIGFAGTATIGSILYEAINDLFNLSASQIIKVSTAADTAVVSSDSSATRYITLSGIIRVTGAGTVIPQITQTTASAAGSVLANSYLKIKAADADGATAYLGPWS